MKGPQGIIIMKNSKFEVKDPRNISMLTDFYELTMANGFFESDAKDAVGVFDIFFRKVPDDGGFAISAGLEQAIDYLNNLKFDENDIDYLRSKGIFSEAFLDYLLNFEFKCSVWAIPEGTPIFPQEPYFTVEGPMIQAQLLETALLILLNHPTLIATKANRIVRSAQGRPVQEFGARRAQGVDAANYGTRAAYIGGCVATSNTMMDRDMGITASGTMAHSWVLTFDTEYEAFRRYAKAYPDGVVLLIDTYNVLKSGLPNAIKVFDEILKPMGKRPIGVRIDSGDIAYLSKKARVILDEAGYPDCKIIASNALDEYIVTDLLVNDAKIDSFGIGEKMITSRTNPSLGGVYKLAAIKKDGEYIPKIKISESYEKITTPYLKQVWRIYSNETGMALADYLAVYDEEDLSDKNEITIFSPLEPWKKQTLTNVTIKPLMVPIFVEGKQVYESPSLEEIKAFAKQQIEETLWDELKRLEYPHKYYVDLSERLWKAQREILEKNS